MIRHLFASQKLDDILDCIKYLTEKSVNGDTEKPSIKKSRFETIKRKYDPFKKIFVLNSRNEDLANFWYEYSLLGNPYSQSLHTIYRAKNPKFTSISEIKKKRPGERVMLVGIVQECNKKTSMKGNRYVKIQILDETAGITALLFDGKDGNNIDRVCDENDGHLPKENDIVIISGKLKEADSIYIDDLGIQSNKIYCKLKDLRDSTEKVNI
jgi:DNA polymerase III alpha subunit